MKALLLIMLTSKSYMEKDFSEDNREEFFNTLNCLIDLQK